MSCSTAYYTTNGHVFEHVLGKENLNAVGIISEKPKLGRGVGSAHAYHTHFSDKEYAGMCYMTYDIFEKFVEYLIDSDLIIDANVLYMSDPKDNIL